MPHPANEQYRRDFDALLQRLSSEVGRLLEENALVTRELQRLQGLTGNAEPKQLADGADQDKFGDAGSPSWPVIGMQLKELPAQQSAWRTADPNASLSVLDEFKAGADAPGTPATRGGSKISTPGNPTLDLFQSLDEAREGKVGFAALNRLLQKHGESCDYLDLVNVLRVHNGLEAIPHSVQDHSEAASSERLSLDFKTFSQLLAPTAIAPAGLSTGLERCVKALQRAAQKEAVAPTASTTNRGVRSILREESRLSVGDANFWRDAFPYIEGAGCGQLLFDDLANLFNKHKESYDYLDLINVLRYFNNLEPIPHNVQDNSEAECSERLYLNLGSFTAAMTAKPNGTMGAGVESCLQSLQTVVRKEANANRGGTGARFSTPTPSDVGWVVSNSFVRLVTTGRPRANIFWLEMVPTLVILVNMVVTGMAIDFPSHRGLWDVCEVAFVVFYTLEAMGKIKYFGVRGFFCGRGKVWNWFDFICLIVSYIDTFVEMLYRAITDGAAPKDNGALKGLQLTKIFRLTRLVRLVRTLRFKIFHELKLMVLGIFAGFRCLSWACVLLLFLAYPMGVGLTSILNNTWEEFDTVPNSMFTLFRCWTEGCAAIDGTPLAERLYREHGFPFMALHILMTMFVTVGLFNLIMAIFIDNVVNTQAHRKAKEMADRTQELEMKFKELFTHYINEGIVPKPKESLRSRVSKAIIDATEVDYVRKSDVESVASDWDYLKQSNATISKALFSYWVEQEEFQQLLDDADIETTQSCDLFDVLDADLGGELSMDELISGLMRLRGPVSKADIVAVRLKVRYLTAVTERMECNQTAGRVSTDTNDSCGA